MRVVSSYYIGVVPSATSGCVVYDLDVLFQRVDECTTPRQMAPEHAVATQDVQAFKPSLGALAPGQLMVYHFAVDEHHSHDNLIVEVELRGTLFDSTGDNPDALELSLFHGSVPDDYESEIVASHGVSGIW